MPALRRSTRSRPNDWGLYNVTGNVWEWCADWFDPGYLRRAARATIPSVPTQEPPDHARAARTSARVVLPALSRLGRSGSEPESSTGNVGFRVVAR
jgi:formylglycine-generating enzyme required for sulfatase activity